MEEVPHAAIAAIATGQRGHVRLDQLRDAGRGRGAVAYDNARDRLHVVHRGVYAVGHTAAALWAAETAAVLAAGDGAVVSHRSAAEVWGLLPREPGRDVDVTFTSPRKNRPGVSLHRTRHLDPRDVTRRFDLPITRPERTLLDAAEQVDRGTVARALNEALAKGLVTPDAIYSLLSRSPGRHGVPLLRALLTPDDGFSRSRAEAALNREIRAAGFPRPHRNVKVGRWELDFFWPAARLNVETDGYGPHTTPQAFERDRRRDADLKANHGIDVMRFSWRTLRDEPTVAIARIAAALARAAATS